MGELAEVLYWRRREQGGEPGDHYLVLASHLLGGARGVLYHGVGEQAGIGALYDY